MSTLTLQRCLHHVEREAVARCVSCTQHFCRECIVEHEGRVVCAECRKKLIANVQTRRGMMRRLAAGAHLLLSVFLLWFCIYLFGKALLLIPSSFHEGDVWKGAAAFE
jgi:hypothetical protein